MVIATTPRALALSVILAIASATPVAAQDAPPSDRPSVVVTTEVLGAVVSQVVGDAAHVSVLMEAGADPHGWQPSARDAETIFGADLIVANGLDLEEGLTNVLAQARADGVAQFTATDHITVRVIGADEDIDDHEDEGSDDLEDGHGHGPGDPHFWLDPVAMSSVVEALVPALSEAGIDVGDRAAQAILELAALDAELARILAVIPDDRRTLVSGHESLGYFAERYDLELVGSVIPGVTTSGEPSARDLAELTERIREVGAVAVFTDVGTPQPVAEVVAVETGARLVELRLAQLPEDGSYASLLRESARTIANALAP